MTFLAVVAVIAFSCARIGLEYIYHRLTKKPQKVLGKRDKTVIVLGIFGALCIAYGYFIEPYWLSVETVQLYSSKLKASTKPLRIVQISDIHSDPTARLEEKLPTVIRDLKPDLIVFTGDAINCPEGLPIFRKLMQSLAEIAPTFGVKGNWDSRFFRDLDRLGKTGTNELDGNPYQLLVGDNTICVTGLPVDTGKSVHEALTNIPNDEYKIFLFHYPDCLEEMAENHIDLYLAGHTHGGQVALPFYGALMTVSAFGKKYEHGLHKMGETYLYVNRGIGMEGGKAPRVRFCARPEVTLFEVFSSR
ncbi:MAG: metallophosphoesterase [Candidatus Obscuribacterales bacterium]|nr:metallophosphoesterase [Candidatus Obscuribacterales bacterium]